MNSADRYAERIVQGERMRTQYLEFEVTLLKVKPRLRRRFLLRHKFNFENLHCAIQLACGWKFCHLYEFRDPSDALIAADEHAEDQGNSPLAANVMLNSYFKEPGQECRYIYDFGDYWEHQVTFIQKVMLPERFIQRLTEGEGVFPPEDCGSVPGYEECVRVSMLTQTEIKKLDPDEREEILSLKKWMGDWRPNGFDLTKAQQKCD
jgi:hypothetical protein